MEVDFAGQGLAANSSTYFSLEGALTAAVITARKGGLSQRYVALGDSVPYGHGLANPYSAPQIGLSGTQQGPSDKAYPALVAAALSLTLDRRTGNCTLTGDDLAISGAAAASADTGTPKTGNSQCAQWPNNESVQQDEWNAAQLAQDPATLVTIQAGADDIHFTDCMKWELSKVGVHFQSGQCVQNNAAYTYFGKCMKWENTGYSLWHVLDPGCVRNTSVSPAQVFTSSSMNDIPAALSNIRKALFLEIKEADLYAKHIAVLNYYQPIPNPVDFRKESIFPGGQVDPVCWALSHNLKGAYNDAVIIQAALNNVIAGAVSDAISAGVKNVQLIDISNLEATHEMCTGDPALFSGELMPKSQFYSDLAAGAECFVFDTSSCKAKEQDLTDHIWRTAHPNAFGQQDIAHAIENQLGSL